MKQVAIIALVNSEHKFLFQLRDNKPNITYPGMWGFIGGHVEEGESLIEGLRREISEEISIEIKDIKEIGSYYDKTIDESTTIYRGTLNVPAENINIGEGRLLKYFGFNEIKNLNTPDPLREFLVKNWRSIAQ